MINARTGKSLRNMPSAGWARPWGYPWNNVCAVGRDAPGHAWQVSECAEQPLTGGNGNA